MDLSKYIGEATEYDKKAMLEEKKPKSWCKSVSAFANSRGGALLADDSPIRHSRLFCTRWNGLTMTSGTMDAIDDKEFSGSLIMLLENGLNFITTNSKKKWKKLADRRIEMPDYPERSYLEGLVNALIHRSYTELGSEVHIDMFDDRLEIYSPGGMYDGTFVQDRDINNIPSKRRNPVIADIFNRLHFMERRGSGFKKICEDYAFAEGYTEKKTPRFNSDNDNFTLILPNLNYNDKNARSRKGPEKVQKQGPETVDRKSAILQLIASNPKISRAKISAQLGLTDKQVRITLDQLVADKKIKHDGPDRGGQWIIL